MKQPQIFSADLYYKIGDSTQNVRVQSDGFHPTLPDVFESMAFYDKMYKLTFNPVLWPLDAAIQRIAYGEFNTNLLRDFK